MNPLRCYKILQQMISENPISSEFLAQTSGLSSRTIRNELREWMASIEKNGARLFVKSGIGYKLEIYEPDRFEVFLKSLFIRDEVPSTACERICYILKLLLDHSGEFVKQEILAEQLYVSQNTISADFKKIKKFLKEYDLYLVGRSGYGISLRGSESDIRYILTQIVKEDTKDSVKIQRDYIFKILVKAVGRSGIKLSETTFHELSAFILVSMRRMEADRTICLSQEQMDCMKGGTEYEAAAEIAKRLTETAHIVFTDMEIGYIAIILACNRIFNLAEMPDYIIAEEIVVLAEKMIEAAYEYCHLDFMGDEELKTVLITHLIPLLARLRYRWPQKNPMLAEIQKRYILGYMIAEAVCRPLEEYAHSRVSKDEKGYFAIHFESALFRLYDKIEKSVLITGTVGKAASQSLVQTIKKWFGSELLKVDACDITRLNEIDLREYDCILSTCLLNDKMILPYLKIPQFLTDKEYPLLRQFFTRPEKQILVREFSKRAVIIYLQSCEKKEILGEIVKKMGGNHAVDLSDCQEYVYKANEWTDVAIVSCLWQEEKGGQVCLAIPKEKVVWDKDKVNYILYINVGGKLDRNFYYLIQTISEILSKCNGRNLNTIFQSHLCNAVPYRQSAAESDP